MAANIIDGKKISTQIKDEVKARVEELAEKGIAAENAVFDSFEETVAAAEKRGIKEIYVVSDNVKKLEYKDGEYRE